MGRLYFAAVGIFLSTPSVRRATVRFDRTMIPAGFLSTPSVRRATPLGNVFCSQNAFLSTPSVRRATFFKGLPPKDALISIHALREEGDCLPQPPL